MKQGLKIELLRPQATRGTGADTTGAARTPAGLERRTRLTLRRGAMLLLCTATYLAAMFGVTRVFGADGLDMIEIGIIAAVGLSAPWTVLGFWNAILGLVLVLTEGGRSRTTLLLQQQGESDAPVTSRVALALAIRNEDATRVFARAAAMRRSLDASGMGAQFDLHLLSDTDDPQIAAVEERLFAQHLALLSGAGCANYRRRETNEGFKAGNVQRFLEDEGGRYDLFIPLDADSLMSATAILKLVRAMEANPRIGILQSLAVGAPSDSAFGRIFQFGMRHGMRGFTLGSAWWQGDCGPFWGHNAVVRAAPFRAFCKLPKLRGRPPLGGEILSHDQIEAVLMRRAGYEVRVLPVETESFEENPVTVLDFLKREQRWCNGNMQYFQLLGLGRLEPVSRFQLVQAIMMYLSAPAWMLLTGLGALKAMLDPDLAIERGLAIGLFLVMVGMSFTPKIVGALHVLFEPGGLRRYGGGARFALGMALETVFSVLMAPVVAFGLTIFLAQLLAGRRAGWQGQSRDAHGLEWRTAARAFWPQTLFGLSVALAIWSSAPGVLWWAAPVIAGLALAIPFAVLSASPRIGEWLAHRRICAIPEEFVRPDVLDLVALPEAARRAAAA